MTASALNLAFPTQPQAAGQGAAVAPTGAAGAFEALLGALFGTQTGVAAELFAGATPGAKTEASDTPAEGEAVDGDTDTSTLAMAIAGAMAIPPAAPLVAGLPVQTTEGEAVAADTPSTPMLPALPQGALNEDAADATPPAPSGASSAQPSPPVAASPAPVPPPQPAPEALAAPVQQAEATVAANASESAEPLMPPQSAPMQPARHRTATAEATHTAQPTAAPAAPDQAVQPVQPQAETQARAALGVEAADAAPAVAQDETADLPAPEIDAPTPAHVIAKEEVSTANAPTAPAATPVRGSPETVAQLAANIVKKLEGRSTRFDVELEPLGLGRVDVRIEIGANGRLTAALSFDNPQAQAELRSRASELTRSLEQAGFDLSGGLSFDVADQRGQQNQAQGDQNQSGAAWRGRAFQAALDQAGDAVDAAVSGALQLQRRWNTGVDIRI